jgi:hypothetical protein
MSGRQSGSVILLAALLGLGACGGGDGSHLDDWSSPPVASQLTAGRSSTAPSVDELRHGMAWRGEFSIVIEVWDMCGGIGELQMSNLYTRTESFSFQTAPPVDYGPAATETNAFFVSGGTDPGRGGVVGLAFMSAGVVGLPGQEDDPLILQFWALEYDDGHLTGTLVRDGHELGVDWNRINDDVPLVVCQPWQGTINMPFPMKAGATLDATITDDQVTLVVEGTSHQLERRWRARATATRIG